MTSAEPGRQRTAIVVDGGLLTGSLRRNRLASGDLLTLLRQTAEQAET